MNLLRQACWFHVRYYLVDAYLVDHRMEDILTRFMFGKQAEESFLPCNYEPLYAEGKGVA